METFELIVTNTSPLSLNKARYCVTLHVPSRLGLWQWTPKLPMSYPIIYQTGPLARINHKIIICLFWQSGVLKLGAFTFVESEIDKIVEFTSATASVLLPNKRWEASTLLRSHPPENLSLDETLLEWYENKSPRKGFWTPKETFPWDRTDGSTVKLEFLVVERNRPKIIDKSEENFSVKETDGSINLSPFFMNPEFSDFKVVCGSTTFPAHRLVLSSRVKYFETMFNSKMKEVADGALKIEDMTPEACQELLRFIYQGQIEKLKVHAHELFIAADKYGMDDLKTLCERELYRNLTVENSLEVYDLSQMHGSPLLEKKAKDIIFGNRRRFVRDAETLKIITNKYPELMFQLFTMLP